MASPIYSTSKAPAAAAYAPDRISFAKLGQPLDVPDLLLLQTESFQWLIGSDTWRERAAERGDTDQVSGLEEVLHEISPIEDFAETMQLSFSDPKFEDPKYTIEECKEQDQTYSAPLFVKAEFINNDTGEIKQQTVFMGDFPLMTDKGTFVINGTERVVVSQLLRSPGVYFKREIDKTAPDVDIYVAQIIPSRGGWLEMEIDKRDMVGVRLDRKRKQHVTVLLKALGMTTEEILEEFHDFPSIRNTLEKDTTKSQDEALIDIYRKMRPGEQPNIDVAKQLLENLYFNPKRYDLARVGRYKVNKKLGLQAAPTNCVLSREDIVATLKYLVRLHRGDAQFEDASGQTRRMDLDDIDHFGNRRLRTIGELIQNNLRTGLARMERNVRERMTTQDVEAITPQSLINIRPVVAAVKEFFGTSQLSQFMDQTNPLAGLTHKRRLSALGPGGLSRERAGFEVRDVHPSHYGRMCPIETPEGPNIGLIGALSTFARVSPFGFIETPYRKVIDGRVTDEIEYLTADEEDEFIIAQANVDLTEAGEFVDKSVLVRTRGGEPAMVRPTEVDYMDVSPRQMVSVSTALIPFLEHDDANRALMGSNMQRQAVPLLVSDAPLVGTGMEYRCAVDAGDVIVAERAGTVYDVTADEILTANDDGTYSSYKLAKFQRSNAGTCINQRPVVALNDHVEVGQVIADGPCTDQGELALGRNLLVAYMPWQGHNYEDAIILSQRLVQDDVLTSVHIEEYEVDTRDTKLGPERFTRELPNISEEAVRDLDERGIIRVGAEVRPGDILVGKTTPKGESELSAEDRLLRAIFGEQSREERDTSLRVPHGESGKIISVKLFDRDEGDDLPPGVNQQVRVHIAQMRKISEGDKLAGRHGNKGVISTILPVEDMPFLEDGTPVDIVLNPLGVPGRMNLGQILELHLGWAAKRGWSIPADVVGEWADRLRVIGADQSDPDTNVATPVFDGAREDEISGILQHTTIDPEGRRLVQPDGKARLFDGRSGEPFPYPVAVGYTYMLKLNHLVDDKIHARSTGPYSMITQQPLGGKAQFGGQRFGEMEVWALEAYGASYALQELLTIKSDDVVGRVKVYEAIVKGHNIPEPGIPESFKVLVKEMQSLCLNIEVLNAAGDPIAMHATEDDFREDEALGFDMTRRERADVIDLES